MLVVALLLGIPVPSEAHVVLDADVVRPILIDLAKYVSESQNGVSGEARGEALYLLGEKVQLLVDLMNLDATSHGKSLYADLLVRRLSEYGIRVTRAEANARYVYDQAAFQEYVRREPRGRRVAEAKFRVIAHAFYGSVGSDPAELVNSDVDQLRRAVGREEAFLKEHPRSENLKEVRFFLAMDYYRLFRHSPDRATAMKYERLASRALREIAQEYPGTAEARAAEVTLEALTAEPRR